nr:tripeptidyl-peptidase 2-like [Leptinotarsa decemlineata]
MAYLQLIDPLDKRILPGSKKQTTSVDLQKVITICTNVIGNINEESILAYIATKTDSRSDAAKIKSTMEQHRNVYLECLSRKGIALCRIRILNEKDENKDEITAIWRSVVKFVDPNETKGLASHILYFSIWHAFINKQYGRLTKFILKMQEDKPSEEVEKKLIEYCDMLKWTHIVQHLQRSMPSKFPSAFRPF